ncbi:MAG: hypothetical protein IJB59_09680 [Oscillospiraceae bacterium]|nr:hypothetical protein [Oscillospiraceae bacterium]
MAETEIFEYTYSAPRQREIQRIRAKYLPREVTRLDQLRALDAGVTRRGTAVSLAHGILYALVLGLGMSCCLVWAGSLFFPGIVIGCIGLAGVAATYPLYNHIVKQDREKIAPEILRLTDEIAVGE